MAERRRRRHYAPFRKPWFERAGDKYLRRSRREKVVPAHDFCYAHKEVVDCACKRIARAIHVAREREVAERGRDILLETPCERVAKGDDRTGGNRKAPARRAPRERIPRSRVDEGLRLVPAGESPSARAGVVKLLA